MILRSIASTITAIKAQVFNIILKIYQKFSLIYFTINKAIETFKAIEILRAAKILRAIKVLEIAGLIFKTLVGV